ncbi:MAG: T9SS type A sorting domain-containing protein [Chlorobi bacterium]|nr:T9SS type A sorting domain-containing protein [Chlorobiota bacterium]
MKKILYILLASAVTWAASAQPEVYKTSWAPGGGSASASGTTAVFTVGEVFTAEENGPATHLSEGFIGPDVARLLDLEQYAPLPGAEFWPNPVRETLRIRIAEEGEYELYVFDLTGKMLVHTRFAGRETALDMRAFRPGYYLVSVVDRANRRMKAVKIRKI